jgi:hypothetical protein
MQNLDHYSREMKRIAQDASQKKGIIGGGAMAWAMMLIGVVVTGTMTYSLTHEGMKSNALWKEWVDFAAFLPVALLEGSALALVYGRHYWFRSDEQRRIANAASWVIWLLLAVTSVVHFALDDARDGTVKWLMSVYASYILPLAIVGVPMLWKRLYDAAPESAMRTSVLEAEASLRSQLVEVQREQNALMIASYREAMDTPRVSAARKALFEQASIEHARNITGFIEGADQQTEPTEQRSPAQVNYHGSRTYRYLPDGRKEIVQSSFSPNEIGMVVDADVNLPNESIAPNDARQKPRAVWRGGQIVNGLDGRDNRPH